MSEHECGEITVVGGKCSKDSLVQNARMALLRHYSSRSTNQATIILTLVIAFLAFIGGFTTYYIPSKSP